VSGQQHAPAALYLLERPGTRFTGGWVGCRTDLDGRKISSPPGFDPERSSPQSVAIPTELPDALIGPHDSRKLRFPDFMTMAEGGGKVVSLKHRPPLSPRKYSWYSFLLEAESTPEL